MAPGAHEDRVWDAAAGRDAVREARDIEAAIAAVLARHTRLGHHRITATVGPDGLVTLTGTVPTQSLQREVELSCWTVPGVRTLHNDLVAGRRDQWRRPTIGVAPLDGRYRRRPIGRSPRRAHRADQRAAGSGGGPAGGHPNPRGVRRGIPPRCSPGTGGNVVGHGRSKSQ